MRPLPTAPSADDEISASFMRRLIECIKERTILHAPGYRTKSGPNGTTLEIETGKRDRPAASVLPWSFSCTEDPDSGERTGGWTNCVLQLGYNRILKSPDLVEGNAIVGEIDGCDRTDDGEYWVEVDISHETAEIKLADEIEQKPIDLEHNKVSVRIGIVEGGNLTHGIHHHPVIYKYA